MATMNLFQRREPGLCAKTSGLESMNLRTRPDGRNVRTPNSHTPMQLVASSLPKGYVTNFSRISIHDEAIIQVRAATQNNPQSLLLTAVVDLRRFEPLWVTDGGDLGSACDGQWPTDGEGRDLRFCFVMAARDVPGGLLASPAQEK